LSGLSGRTNILKRFFILLGIVALSNFGFNAAWSGQEWGVDRSVSDYRSFNLTTDSPAAGESQCTAESQCQAWTYVKPGIQGAQAKCWLKNAVPLASTESCCTSGVK
jgi:hypothetical protein